MLRPLYPDDLAPGKRALALFLGAVLGRSARRTAPRRVTRGCACGTRRSRSAHRSGTRGSRRCSPHSTRRRRARGGARDAMREYFDDGVDRDDQPPAREQWAGEQAAARRRSWRDGGSRRCVAAPAMRRPPVRAGRLSPDRPVPAAIPRPPYAPDAPALVPAVPPDEFADRMRAAGRAAREVLLELGAAVRPGITTDELDRICHEACIARGGYPSPLALQGLPEVVVHVGERGHLPRHPRRPRAARRRHRQLRRHDLSCTACTATATRRSSSATSTTSAAGSCRSRRKSMWKGIDAVRAGRRINDIGRAIQDARRGARASASCARSSATASARSSTPRRRCPHFYDPHADTRDRRRA